MSFGKVLSVFGIAALSALFLSQPSQGQVAGAPNVSARQHVELSSYIKFPKEMRLPYSRCAHHPDSGNIEGALDTSINFSFERVTQTMPRGKLRDWNEIIPDGAALIITDIAWKLGNSRQMDPGGYLQVRISTDSGRAHDDYFTHPVGDLKSWRGVMTGRQSMTSGILYMHGEEICATITYFNNGNVIPPVQSGGLTGYEWHYVKLYGYLVEMN